MIGGLQEHIDAAVQAPHKDTLYLWRHKTAAGPRSPAERAKEPFALTKGKAEPPRLPTWLLQAAGVARVAAFVDSVLTDKLSKHKLLKPLHAPVC